MKMWTWNEPWVNNYLALRPTPRRYGVKIMRLPKLHAHDFYADEIWWLACLSRGVSGLIDREKISGNPSHERLCKFVLDKIKRVADFTLLEPTKSEYLEQIRNAQKRLEGLLCWK